MCEGTYQWPEGIPRECPLSDAEPTDGVHYRVVYTNPADENGFLRTKDDPNQKVLREKFYNGELTKEQECMAYATSHHSCVEASIDFIRLFKRRMKKMPGVYIAEVGLNPGLGCMKQTGTAEHKSVWYQIGVAPWESVQQMTEVDLGAI